MRMINTGCYGPHAVIVLSALETVQGRRDGDREKQADDENQTHFFFDPPQTFEIFRRMLVVRGTAEKRAPIGWPGGLRSRGRKIREIRASCVTVETLLRGWMLRW